MEQNGSTAVFNGLESIQRTEHSMSHIGFMMDRSGRNKIENIGTSLNGLLDVDLHMMKYLAKVYNQNVCTNQELKVKL